MAIPYLDTLIANINSRLSGEVVSASVFNPDLIPDDEALLRAYLDTLIANINSRFSGEVVSASVFNPDLLPDDETLLRAYGNSKLSTLANFYGEKAEVKFEGLTYSSLAIINKEELLGEWQVFKRSVFQNKIMMVWKKAPALHLCKT